MNVTILIILHNRHHNIARLVEYYKDINASIILADSSTQKHPSGSLPASWKHVYTPDVNYTQKVELVLQEVSTQYVILCADDDFIIPAAINKCVVFLNSNLEYASAQGRCVCYKKSEVVGKSQINFYPLYPQFEYSYEDQNSLSRLDHLLGNYKSFLYAVHHTAILRDAYTGTSANIRNLYLNEYNASILPLVKGKYKELPFLYQVREYAEDSDDKTAINIHTLLKDPAFKPDIDGFVAHLSSKICSWTKSHEPAAVNSRLITGLGLLAANIEYSNNLTPSLKKRLGQIVELIPLIGKKIIEKSRKNELRTQMSKIISTEKEQKELDQIRSILKAY